MKIFLSAAEVSSDTHGAALLRALKRLAEDSGVDLKSLEVFGTGGAHLQKEGLEPLIDARELLAMGFVEVLGRIPRILKSLNVLAQEVRRRRPDVIVLMDYPGFHFRLARKLRDLDIPMIYYIPPKVWAWRKERVQFLRENFKKVLCIFPFEESFYQEQGMDATYVGNPLMDELPLDLDRQEARERLGITPMESPQKNSQKSSQNSSTKTVVLMPGSRPAELKRHLEPMLEATLNAQKRLACRIEALIPLPFSADLYEIQRRVEEWGKTKKGLSVRVFKGRSAECLKAADAGLIKSGTSTLESALMGCPQAVIYKPNWISTQIVRYFVRYEGPVGLVNLVAGVRGKEPRIAKEILCEEVTAENLTNALCELLDEKSPHRLKQLDELKKIREALGSPGASERAAREILEVVGCSLS